jgi:transposase
MVWITRTGAPWRDLPREFGNWNTVHRRFRRWVQSGVFQRIFDVIEEELDLRAVMVDGTFAKVHQHGAGAKKAVARLRNRLSGRLSAVVEAGLPPSSWPWLTRPDALSGSR